MPYKRDYLRMDPSTEQLIRDYLNRLAVAARSSLSPDELRAFLGRVHDSIDRQCAVYGSPSTAEVSSALAAMGEPAALVGREHARLAAARAGLDASSPRAAGASAATTATATDSPTGGPAVTAGTPAVTAGTMPSAQRTGSTAPGDSGERPLRFPGKTRRNAGRRSGQPAAEAGPGADPVSARTASQRAVQRRSVTSRRRPAEILTDRPAASKNAVRPRGPQGRDSPVLLPLKRNTLITRDPPADPEPGRGVPPDPADQPGTAVAFVVAPPQDPQTNVVAPPKFQPVSEPVAWPGSSPGRRRGPAPGASRGPGPATELGSEPGAEAGPEPDPGQGPDQGAWQGTDQDPGHGPDQDPGQGPEQRTELGSEPGAGRRPVRGPGPSPAGQPGDDRPRRRAATRTVSGSIESSMRERAAASVSVFLQRAPGLARQHPLECAAVILLGLGGLIFPPIWLLGALVALPSRLWDIRDKLTGLAAPAVVAIVGGAGLAMGSSHTSGGAYFHEALTIGGYLIRAGAVLGAVYLAWRVQRGQRQPVEPPWRRQYR
jgi:hypothetical protein